MKNNIDKPFINIEIYRLDIYRLLTLLLSDKQIAENNTFSKLGTDFTDGEVDVY